MKKIDYYAVQNPWKMPKWLGAGLGGIFGVIAIGSVMAIVQITKSNAPAPIAAVGAAPMADQSPAAKPAVASPKAAAVVAAAPDDDDSAAEVKPAKRASKHHAAKSKKSSMRLASAKRAPALSSSAGRATMLAKHDTKSKRSDKDALDKLLGL